MIFGLLRVLNGVPKGGIPRSQVKPTPVHSGVAVGILVTSIIVIGVMMVTGLSMGLLTACIVGFSALILGSLFVRGVSEASQKQTRLKNMSPPRPAPPTPMQMRARAAVLERPKTVASQKPCAPASVLSPEPAAHVVKPVVKTYQEILTDRELTARMERIAALLIVTCPDCGAGEAELCSYIQTINNPDGGTDAPLTLLDRERSIIVHDSRIGLSIKEHIAKVTDVVAQYDDHVPESVWRYAV
jgi:hypothetical protein